MLKTVKTIGRGIIALPYLAVISVMGGGLAGILVIFPMEMLGYETEAMPGFYRDFDLAMCIFGTGMAVAFALGFIRTIIRLVMLHRES